MRDNEILMTVLNKILLNEDEGNNEKIPDPELSEYPGYEKLAFGISRGTYSEKLQTEELIKQSIFQEVWKMPYPPKKRLNENLDDSVEEIGLTGNRDI